MKSHLVNNMKYQEWKCYHDYGSFPQPEEKMGRCLGPAQNEGNQMSQFVLTSKGTEVPRRTLRKLTKEELQSPIEICKRKLFDRTITMKLGDSISGPIKTKYKKCIAYLDNHTPNNSTLPIENDPVNIHGVSVYENQ